jgi:chromosome segregation ATPase
MDIEQIIKKRNNLEQRKNRLLGRMEVAKSALSEIDSQLQDMGVNPANLSSEIARLKEERETMLMELQEALNIAESTISKIESRVESIQ